MAKKKKQKIRCRRRIKVKRRIRVKRRKQLSVTLLPAPLVQEEFTRPKIQSKAGADHVPGWPLNIPLPPLPPKPRRQRDGEALVKPDMLGAGNMCHTEHSTAMKAQKEKLRQTCCRVSLAI